MPNDEPIVEEYNCLITTQSWSWTLVNPQEWGYIDIVDVPEALTSEEEVKLDWVDIYCAKFINPNTAISNFGVSYGQVTSNNAMTITVAVKDATGKKIWANETHKLSNNKVTMQPAGSVTNQECWADVPGSYKYHFTFPEKVVLKGKSADIVINMTGVEGPNTNGVSFRGPSQSIYRKTFGQAHISKVTNYPTHLTPELVSPDGIWITNLTGKAKNGRDILADSTESFKVVANADDVEIVNDAFTGNRNVKCTLAFPNVKVVAANKTADYPTADNITLSVEGDNNSRVSCSFKVNFYKKPSVSFSEKNIKVNIKRTANLGFVVSKFDVGNLTKGKTYSALKYTLPSGNGISWDLNSKHVPNSSNIITIDKYLGVESDSKNFFKIANESKTHKLTYRYFNPSVQKETVSNNYNSDIDCTFIFYAKPTEKAQFSFDWLTGDGSKVTVEPPAIISGFNGAPVPGNLRYSNESVTGGYCRAIKLSFYRNNGSLLYEEIRYTTDQNDGSSLLAGRFINKNDALWVKLRQLLGDSYVTEKLTVRADLAFCFDDNKTKLYYGCYHIWDVKLWLVTEDDFNVQLLFPVVNEAAPATPMMLTDVERFGYIFPDAVVENMDLLGGPVFSLTIGGKTLAQRSNPEYFSSNQIVKNLVVDVGKFVADNKLYLSQCEVLPCLTIFTDEEYEQKITFSNNWVKPNAIINTLESTMWYRPTAEKGQYATYFDVDRFQQFIDKYYPLNNDRQKFSPIVKEKRGDIINTDFWKLIEEKLNIYTQNMQVWASNITNMIVIWAFPEFKHKKGEYITNNNLYQNYWDLLHMFSGYESFATHDYIEDSGYSHNDLGVHSHNDITNKRGI